MAAAMREKGLSERAFQAQVVKLAQMYGWLVHHHQWSFQSAPGWPDLVLCRSGELVIAELKTDKGLLSVAQAEWISMLETVSGITVRVWRPADWPEIQELLTRRTEQ